jgi:hypothetical protein
MPLTSIPPPVTATCADFRFRRKRVADLECLDADRPVTLLTVLLEQSMGLERPDDEHCHL